MTSSSKTDWQYAYLEKLKAPKVRMLLGERGIVVDGPLEPQIEQITSAGFPSWTLYNNTRRYLLGAVSTSITFAYLSYKGDYQNLLADFRTLMEDLSSHEQPGPIISRAIEAGGGPSKHIVVDFTFRVDKLGSDLSLTRDQKISSTFKLKRMSNDGYILWCHPNTRYDYKQMLQLTQDAAKRSEKDAMTYPYAPCPTQRSQSIHFESPEDANGFFLNLFTSGFLGLRCDDVFKADTFEWESGFEFLPRTGDEVIRDRAEVIKRIRVEGAQLNLDSGAINDIIGQGHAIHHFGATFSTTYENRSYQLKIDFRFTSRPLGASIVGGPLLTRSDEQEWTEYPDKEVVEKLLVGSAEYLIQRIHHMEVRLPGAYRSITEIL